MDDLHTETSADAPLVANGAETPTRPAHLAGVVPGVEHDEQPRRRRRWVLPTILLPVLLVVVLVIAWVVDTSSGEVARNVELAGVDIGGLSEVELAGRVGEVAADFATLPVELQTEDATYTTTAGEIGLMVDEEETAAAAMEVGEGTFLLARPFAWARSLFTTRKAPLRGPGQRGPGGDHGRGAARAMLERHPMSRSVEVVDGSLSLVPGVDGVGLDASEITSRLPGAAQAAVAADAGVIRLEVEPGPIPPLGSDEAARQAVEQAKVLVGEVLNVATSGEVREIPADQLRSWVRLTSSPDGTVAVTLDEATVAASLRRAFADIEGHPVNASFTLEGGVPVIRPDQPGKVCCADGSSATLLAAMHDAERTAELTLVDGPASFTAAEAEKWEIKEPVGGNNAWRNGAPTTAGPGFTTYHDAGGARVTNIHRMADLVRGAVIPPGGSFSINDHVGERTAAKGFVGAGAIRDGKHVTEIGGGVSQFATTMFNAAYFAGLPIDESQAHSEYFDRYPRGREATMGFPEPDLAFTNDTPYGIMIWTSYTDTSLTVTLYSTPYARGEQTGISEGRAGQLRCRDDHPHDHVPGRQDGDGPVPCHLSPGRRAALLT